MLLTKYYYDAAWRILEERNGSDQVIRQNVWGNMYIDELVQTGINTDPVTDDEVDEYYYAQHNANFNIMGIVDDQGAIVERYEYTPYGQRTVYFPAGPNDNTAHAATTMSRRVTLDGDIQAPWGVNPIGHQGLTHDESVGLIQNRHRVLQPRMGRFMQRDPLGYPDGMNAYAGYHVMHGGVDPFGFEQWMLHLHDHGGAHIQLNQQRWDARTLRPIKHKGKTPPPLTARQLESLRKSGIWDRLMRNVPNNAIERVARDMLAQEVQDEMKKRGSRCLSKRAAREVAEQVLRKSPLLVFFVIADADVIAEDLEERGLVYAIGNQVVPITLIDDMVTSGQRAVQNYLYEEGVAIRAKTYRNAGFSASEADALAREMFQRPRITE